MRERLVAALCAVALATSSLAPAARAQVNLPALGDAAAEEFGIGAERKLGDQIMREIRRDPDYIDDPLLLEYLQTIWVPLVARSRALGHIGTDIDTRFAWESFLVRDRSVNAFALPGGYVGVHLGLIAMTGTRDELASVLAHELSHVTQRHIARGVANNKRQSLLGVAAMILGVLAAARSNSADAANAVLVGGQAASIQGQLNFSRDMEREADRIGFAVMTGAGFAPAGMALMFEKLDQGARLNDNNAYPYLRSHPLTTERIGEARQRLGAAALAVAPSGLEHTLAQARARVLMDTRADALRRWLAADAERSAALPSEKLAVAYEAALAATQLRDWDRVDAALARLRELMQGNPRSDRRAERAVLMLGAESLVARGDGGRATQMLKALDGDSSRPVMMLAGQALLRTPTPEAAALKRSADDLQTWVSVHPMDAPAWALLGQSWALLGQPLRAVRADAETRLVLGDLPGAIDRLRAGQRMARSGSKVDFIEASVIDARLRAIEAEFRQLTLEEREAK